MTPEQRAHLIDRLRQASDDHRLTQATREGAEHSLRTMKAIQRYPI
jgi:hypothetical protein